MCGIVAVLPVYPSEAGVTPAAPPSAGIPRPDQDPLSMLAKAAAATAGLTGGPVGGLEAGAAMRQLTTLTGQLRSALDAFSQTGCARDLVVDPAFRGQAGRLLSGIGTTLNALDLRLDTEAGHWHPEDLERVQVELRAALDLTWALDEDRVRAADRVLALAGGPDATADPAGFSTAASISLWAVDTALDAVDRLEVRGRDSAGVHLWISLDAADRLRIPEGLAGREDELFRSGACVVLPTGVSLVYKTASVVGALGDNVRSIRHQIAEDADLRALLRLPSARVSVLAHTRWASVGRVNAANAHPLNNLAKAGGADGRYAVGVLNGDIDNHLALRLAEGLPDLPEITTDAKVIPLMAADRLASGLDTPAAMADCLQAFTGSMAIALQSDENPDRLVLAVKGGGQGLYVGLSPFGYLVASEIFGLVARADQYISLEAMAGEQVRGTGAVVVVDRTGGGGLAGVRQVDAAGAQHAVTPEHLQTAELTTRDVACRGYDRYLEKELAEAPTSFRKTLRGRIVTEDGRLCVRLPGSALPQATADRLKEGGFEEILVIGQGTAAVAAQGIAHLFTVLLDSGPRVSALPASELSAARLPEDMSRTCIIAVSQSGTTTDTNRTVDLTRARGATVLAIVNRRQSDLVTKSHGVLYTGDGRDIEMAVASTKAFYAQVAAGMLLGLGVAKAAGLLDTDREDEHLRTLVEMPDKLQELQERKGTIEAVADLVATRHTYWAVVGSGANRVAASEVRIKLSELCYRGVAADAVEDKKHIDLSAESLILICAAGAPVTQLADLTKEVAIFSAHRNTPVVIAEDGAQEWPTEHVIEVPAAHPMLAWVLSTAAGHLFSYYAARAIDATADPLRAALAALELGDRGPAGNAPVREPLGEFVDSCLRGDLHGVLSSDVALRVAAGCWYLDGAVPAELLLGSVGLAPPSDPMDALGQILTDAVEELTRSIDSVKHQAKTVTVGTSRSGAELFDGSLVRAVLESGVQHEALSYATLIALRAHAPMVSAVRGATRYAIVDGPEGPRIRVIRKLGLAADLRSRAEAGVALTGSKKLAVDTRAVRLERGRLDGRVVLLVPEVSGPRASGLTLLHLQLGDRATAAELIASLECSGSRLAEISAAVTEQDHPFEPAELEQLPVEQVLLAPVDQVAGSLVRLPSLP
jgi:glucosamine--fructose-6-phosphate aminotransferase (isomerizing)